MKRTVSAGKASKSNGSSTKPRRTSAAALVNAAVCLKNDGCDDLEPRKLYRLLPDKQAAAEGYVRVVDESGDDYLYPASFFIVVRVPAAVAKTLSLIA
jgi:hypothetical protein